MIEHYPFMNQLIGMVLPTNHGGEAGRTVENLIESMGLIFNRGSGQDLPALGIEVKTRELTATSPQTIGSITIKDLISTPYPQSQLCSKFQKQLRIKTLSHVITEAKIYNFGLEHIQHKMAASYENGRAQVAKDPDQTYYPINGHWGYFERIKESNSLLFRISDADMIAMEQMASSTFRTLFEEQ
jgi:hypothetical protein